MRIRVLTFLFLFVLVFGVVPLVSAQSGIPELGVNVSPSFARVGGSVNVTLRSNVTGSFLCTILNPSNVTVYSQYYLGNASFLYGVPSVYGLYTVNYGNVSSWFWMQDESGLQSRSLPYSFSWKGVDYTVNANYTVTAVSGDGLINVDWVGSLIGLLNNPMVTVTSSDSAVRLQVVRNPYRFDVWWYKQYRGLVFRANGSMSNAINGRWNITVLNAKWGLDCVRSGFLTYDWSDLRGQGVSFSLNKTSSFLSVSIPKTFDLYDSVFSDGFESGDTSAWTAEVESNGALTVETSQKHTGSYGLESNLTATAWAEARVYKSVTASDSYYVRGYFKLNDYGNSGNDRVVLEELTTSSAGFIASVGYMAYYGEWRWRLDYSAVTWSNNYTVSFSMDTDKWYCIELAAGIGSSTGWARVWIDGTKIYDQQGANMGITQIARGYAGCQVASAKAVITYADCVVVDSSYVGLESSVQNLSFDCSAGFNVSAVGSVQRTMFKSGSVSSVFTGLSVVQRTMFSGGSVGVVFSSVESEVLDLARTFVSVVGHVDVGAVLDWVTEGGEVVVRYATESLVYSLGLLGLGFVLMVVMIGQRRNR